MNNKPFILFYRQSASCTHVSGLLHALTAICSARNPFQIVSAAHVENEEEDSALPITSFICQWVKPRKRKESSAKISESEFLKHVYGRTVKHELKTICSYDPRPAEYRGNSSARLGPYLEKVRSVDIGMSVLLDESMQVWSEQSHTVDSSTLTLPSKSELEDRAKAFISSLHLSPDKIREIERNTTLQSQSSSWFTARKYRLTASVFGEVYRRKENTPPDSLVLRIIEPRHFTSTATDWGKANESVALQQYETHLKAKGSLELTVCRAGFVVCETHPFLGASPDSYVYDPSRQHHYGLVEVKCPYKYKDIRVAEACSNTDFCAELIESTNKIRLKRSHPYYSQVQGQMAITERKWCDFLVYTTKDFAVDTIDFDEDFWKQKLLPALEKFYCSCVAPEIVSPVHYIGLPVRDLSKM